jgi:hypothetical protein
MKAVLILAPLFAAILLGSGACSANPAARAPWINALIARYEAEPVANPPHRVLSYRYREQTVYYVPPSCCDQPSTLYDQSGEVVCAPDGGLTGRGDGRCEDFSRLRSDEALVWADPRSR